MDNSSISIYARALDILISSPVSLGALAASTVAIRATRSIALSFPEHVSGYATAEMGDIAMDEGENTQDDGRRKRLIIFVHNGTPNSHVSYIKVDGGAHLVQNTLKVSSKHPQDPRSFEELNDEVSSELWYPGGSNSGEWEGFLSVRF